MQKYATNTMEIATQCNTLQYISKIPKRTNGFWVLYAISFVDLFAVGVLFPFLGPYIKSLGCTETQVGVVASVYAALQVISGPIIGSWSDVRGRKPIFYTSLLVCTVIYFFMGISSTVSILFVYRMLLGLFKHTQTLIKAIISDLTGNNKQMNTAVYGKCASFGSMGFVIGPVVGGQLGELKNGFQLICTVTALSFLVNTLLVYFLPNMDPARTARGPVISRTIRHELNLVFSDLSNVNWTKYWGPFILKFLFILVTTMFFTCLPLYLLQAFKAGKLGVGYVISFVSLIGVICGFGMVPLTKFVYKEDEPATIRTYHVFLLLTICFLGFFAINNFSIFAFLLLPFGIANAVLRIVTMELVFDKSEDYERGSLTGASDSMMALGRFMAPMMTGFVADRSTPEGVMLFAAMLSLIGACVAYHLFIIDKICQERPKKYT